MKRKMLLFLVCCLTVSMAFVAACSKKDIELVNFETKADTAVLGEEYALLYSVADKDGNSYDVTAVVTKTDGSDVEVVAGAFEVDDMQGYKIVYTVVLSSKKTKSATVTVTVKDEGKPVISVSGLQLGIKDVEYSFDKVRITDNSGEVITPTFKVYFLGESQDAEPQLLENAVTNAKFTPSLRGYYKVDVTAVDAAGNSASKSGTFFVRNALTANALEDFDDPSTLGVNIDSNRGSLVYDDKEHLAEFEGRNGVLAIRGIDGGWQNYGAAHSFKFVDYFNLAASGLDFYSINIDMYVATDYTGDINIFNRNYKYGVIEANKWQTVTMSASDLYSKDTYIKLESNWQPDLSNAENFYRSYYQNGHPLFWVRLGEGSSANKDTDIIEKVYIDKITITPKVDITFDMQNAVNVGEQVTVSASASVEGAVLDYVVLDPKNNEVNLVEGAFTATILGQYKVTATVKTNGVISGSKTFTVFVSPQVFITFDEIDEYEFGDIIDVPTPINITLTGTKNDEQNGNQNNQNNNKNSTKTLVLIGGIVLVSGAIVLTVLIINKKRK